MIPGRTELSAPTRHQEPAAPPCSPSVGADAYIGPTGFSPHPRQGTRALPYKVLCYRARTGRVVRPYKSAAGRGDVDIAPYAQHEAATGRGVEDAAPYEILSFIGA